MYVGRVKHITIETLWHIVHLVEYQCRVTGASVEPLPSRGRARHARRDYKRAAVCKRPYKLCKLEFKFVNQQSEWAFASGALLDLV